MDKIISDGTIQKRIVPGFVVQTYRTVPTEQGGFIACEAQEFIEGEPATWEDEFGDELHDVPLDETERCQCLMVQPKPIPKV